MPACALLDRLSALTRAGLVGLLSLVWATPAMATTWTVDSTSANAALNACSAAPGDCSFPGAVSRLGLGGDTIVFAVPMSSAIEVLISRGVTIEAAGARLPRLVIDSNGIVEVEIRDAIFENLAATADGGAIAIGPTHSLVIQDSQFRFNRSNGSGGAIHTRAREVTITRTLFEGNFAPSGAGAIHMGVGTPQFPSRLRVTDSVFRGNGVLDPTGPGRALGQFGALKADGHLRVRGCLFESNESKYASAIQSGNLLLIDNSTFWNNRTFENTEGGALLLGGPVRIANSTIVGNAGVSGGGLHVYPSSDTQVVNTVIANNTGLAPDVSGRVYSHGHNLIRSRDGANVEGNLPGTDLYETDPRLGPIGNHGGPTRTLPLLPDSPLRDAGNACVLGDFGCGELPEVALDTDQRGTRFARQRGSQVDIGAFELGSVLVSNDQDSGAGSLRQAIGDAQPGDVVSFSPAYFNQPRTIALASTLVVNKSISILGPGSNLLTLDGNNQHRLLNVDAPASANLRGIRFTRGNPGANVSGGAILVNLGTLNASEIVIDNSTGHVGGCLYNNGTLLLARARLSGCRANHSAGLFNEAGRTATISDTRIEDNIATGPGGGIGNPGILTLTNVSLSGNQATIGGGLNSYGTAAVSNSTFSGNTAENGGGMYLGGTATTTLTHVTVTGNTAQFNGGVGSEFEGTVNLQGSLLAGNTRTVDQAPDAGGNFTSFGYNLIGSPIGLTFRPGSSLVGNQIGVPARLAALADNGGFALTHAPLYDSQATDAGGPGLALDGRGLGRPVDFSHLGNASGGNGSDIGAFELQVATPANVVAAPAPNGLSVSFAGGANGGSAISSYRVVCGDQSATGSASPIIVTGLASGVAVSCSVTASSGALTGIPSAPSSPTAPAELPGAPVIGTAVAGNGQVTVAFTPSASNGGSAITGYTATCGTQSQSGPTSPIVVTGLANGTPVTCTVIATNAVGNSPPSAPSASVTPATVPDAPGMFEATAGNASASVRFSPPASNGGAPVEDYTATCMPGGASITGNASPLTVTGLVNGTLYDCVVSARNAVGTGPVSVPSSLIPTAVASADLAVTMSNGTRFVTGGAPTIYTITVSNSGPSGVARVRVMDTLDPDFSNPSWACTAQGGAVCAANGIGGPLDELVDLPLGSSVTILLTATVAPLPETPVSNLVSVTLPAPFDDPNLQNNVATDGPDIRGLFRDGFD